MTKPPFPHVWDSTMVGTLRSCARKLELQYIHHWKPQTESVHLVAGGAFASGLEAARRAFYEQGLSPSESVAMGLRELITRYGDFECPPDSAKSLERMCGALEFYFDNYPLGQDGATPIHAAGEYGIEFSFAVPLDIRHPVTGDPLLYAGRADMVANAFGGIFVFDEKTTSSLGASWAKQWEMRSQFTGYVWALAQFGIKAQGCIVRGVSILKTKYETQQVITYRPEWQVERWLWQTRRDILRAIEMWKEGFWDYNLDHSCSEYGGCAFQRVCLSPDPDAWLPTYFTQRVWDPLAREEITVEEWNKKWEKPIIPIAEA